MATRFDRFGPWDIPYRATGVICPDGKTRTVRLSGHADTFWTMPARLSYKGKTVTGFITNVDDIFDLGQQFIPTGKHRDIFGVSGTGKYLNVCYVDVAKMCVVTGTNHTRIFDIETRRDAVLVTHSAEKKMEVFDNYCRMLEFPDFYGKVKDLIRAVNRREDIAAQIEELEG